MKNGMKKALILAYGLNALEAIRYGYRDTPQNHEWQAGKEVVPKGTKFIFEDGFTCYALNRKNAERKHRNFKK